jgi:hypothetical protein
MSKYLLLRSNKQTGPYTLEEIQAMALKAYDLIWVEGKSAAWRYPGEIEEFKSFAPPVEEQPFDRFFKKPVPENLFFQNNSNSPSSPPEKEKRQFIAAVSEQPKVSTQPNSVYVNLPAAKKMPVEKEKNQAVQEPEKKQITREENITATATQKENTIRTFTKSLPAAADERVALEEKFSQPLDDIKKQYVEKVLNQKTRARPQMQFPRPVILGIGILALLAAGIFIGLSINKHGTNPSQKDLSRELAVSDQPADDHTRTIPVSSSGRPGDKRPDNANLSQPDQAGESLIDKTDLGAEKKKTRASKPKATADTLQHLLKTTSFVDSEALTAQREATRRADALLAKEAVKNNITNVVFLSSSKYNVGTFGGISELQITVSNRSLYPLDLVVVEVEYIQSNKKVFKTENLYFHNIGAGSALMVEAPKSPRGIKVQYKIAMINSKELGLSYTGL